MTEADDEQELPPHLLAMLHELPELPELPDDLEARTFAAIERAADDEAASGLETHDTSTVISLDAARRKRRTRMFDRLIGAAAAVLLIAGIGSIARGTPSHGPVIARVALASPVNGSANGNAIIHQASNGLDIDLTVSGLAQSAPGTIYTCWLVGAGDTIAHQNRVSVGSFVVGKDGKAKVQWTTAAGLSKYPTLGITLEPANGNPLHQGPKVLQQV